MKRIAFVGFCAIFAGFSAQGTAADALKFVNIHASAVDGIWSIHANFSVKVTNVERPDASDSYTVEYFGEHDRERWITRREGQHNLGAFTKTKYDTGIEDLSNGINGFCRVQGFDGRNIDSDSGLLPVDSPASALFGPRVSGKVCFLARLHMGLEVLGEARSKPISLAEFFASSTNQTAEVKNDIVELACTTPAGKLEVLLDAKLGYVLKSYRFLIKNGEELSFKYADFQKHDSYYFPHALEHKFGRLLAVAKIEYPSVNQKLEDKQLTTYLPPGIPFHDRKKDVAGIWGNGEPQFLFASKQEAMNWDTERKKAFVKNSTPNNFYRNFAVVLSGTVLVMVFVRSYWMRRRGP